MEIINQQKKEKQEESEIKVEAVEENGLKELTPAKSSELHT